MFLMFLTLLIIEKFLHAANSFFCVFFLMIFWLQDVAIYLVTVYL